MFEKVIQKFKKDEEFNASEIIAANKLSECETKVETNKNSLSEFDKQSKEISELKAKLKSKEVELNNLSSQFASKEKMITMLNKKLSSNEEELTGYINKIFEHQERERIVKWIVSSIRESLEIKDVLLTTVEEVGKLLRVDRCLIALYEENSKRFELKNEFNSNLNEEFCLKNTKEITISPEWKKRLLLEGEPIVINDVSGWSNLSKNGNFICPDVKSFAIAPVAYKGEILGLIIVCQTKFVREWKETHIGLLKYIGTQIAIAIRQAKLYTNIKKQSARESLMRKIISMIRGSLDHSEVLSTICAEIANNFDVDRVVIARLKGNSKKSSVWQIEKEYKKNRETKGIINEKNSNKISGEISNYWWENFVNQDLRIIVSDIKSSLLPDKIKEYYEQTGTKSLIGLPIKKNEDCWGGIFLSTQKSHKTLSEDDLNLLQTITEQVYIAIRQADLYAKSEKTNQLKSEFLASVSHELRTPLNAIIGFSDMFLNARFKNLTTKQTGYINNILVSGNHLLKLVNDILDLSKIESGNMSLNIERFNHKVTILEVVSSVESMALKKDINIEINLSNAIIKADSKRFMQIMYNLLSNAIKFTEEGGKITVNSSAMDNSLYVEVIDTGIGISPESQSKVFEQFAQLDSSYARKQEGTGLGLALTKKFIEMHKGKIYLESQKGEGSKFSFELPGVETH